MIDIRTDPKVEEKPAGKPRKKGGKKKRAAENKPARSVNDAADSADKTAQSVNAAAPRKTVEAWLKAKGVSAPLAAALWRYTKWGRGRLVSEEQFEEALGALYKRPASEV